MSTTLPETSRQSRPVADPVATLVAAVFLVFALARFTAGIPVLVTWAGSEMALAGAGIRTAIAAVLLVTAIALVRRARWARRMAMVTAAALAVITTLHLGWVLARQAPARFHAAMNPSATATHAPSVQGVVISYTRTTANAAALVMLDLVILGVLARRKPEEEAVGEAK